jgi:hypothetical protein
MSQNRNIVSSHYEWMAPCQLEQGSWPSIFSFQNADAYISQDATNRIKSFSDFVTSRTQYLSRLRNLGDNWISGHSKRPTVNSINRSKDILNGLKYWYSSVGYKNFVYPKVIMSPTPTGGIGMEIELFPELRAFVTVLEDKIEYDVEKNGYYVEYEADNDNVTGQLLALYNSKANMGQPTGQRIPEIVK